ncbi:MAG: penicillin-binding transpeptidase domain-containing protein [Bacillota bacterium]
MFKRKGLLFLSLIIIIFIVSVLYILFIPDPVETAKNYKVALEDENYEEIYKLLTEESQEKFDVAEIQNSYEKFYSKLNLKSKNINNLVVERENLFNAKAEFKIKFTSADFNEQEYEFTMNLERENLINWKINWDHNLVHPTMEKGDEFIKERIVAKRGEIYDQNNNLIAKNGEIIVVGLQPSKIEKEKEFIEKMKKILKIDEKAVRKSINRYNNSDWFSALKNLSLKEYEELESQLRPIPGVFFRKKEARVYPYGELTSHITGHIGEVSQEWINENSDMDYRSGDIVGQSALERSFEKTLRGKVGYILYKEDSEGNKNKLMKKEAVKGNDIRTTIDIELQQIIYEELKGKKGAVVVLEPESGKIIAMYSNPSYDSNQFSLGVGAEKWLNLTNDKNLAMLNRATQGLYPPGSTFKIITAAAALNEKIVDSNSKFIDKGEFKISGNVIRNYQNEVFEEHNFKEALTHSINTTFAKVALELKKDKFLEYVEKFSFEEKIDFSLRLNNSSVGIINDEVSLAWSALGQGEVLTTPLEMSRIIAIIANNGSEVKPYLIKNNKDKAKNEQIITKKTADELKEMLVNVVKDGTAKNAKIENIKIAGKTGTAEINDKNENTHAWFLGFTPVNKPQYAISIFLEKGGVGGKDAAPVFKNILKKELSIEDN